MLRDYFKMITLALNLLKRFNNITNYYKFISKQFQPDLSPLGQQLAGHPGSKK